MSEQIETRSKKGRGRAKKSLLLIQAMRAIAEKAQPITGRGVAYKLFVAKLIGSMSTGDMAGVYRLLKEARDEGIIDWQWIVDETREIERVGQWDDPEAFSKSIIKQYRRDFWNQQPHRITVVSEKGTVRGVLRPVLAELGVGFLPVHGFSSATAAHDLAIDDDGRPLILLYVGDFDPSGLYMSEVDLPKRFEKYGGAHIQLRRIALTLEQVRSADWLSWVFLRPTRARTLDTPGSSGTTGTSAGSLTPWTRSYCAIASRIRSPS
jgi:hypothetical protein